MAIHEEGNAVDTLKKLEENESWGDRNWRQYAAIVYLVICVFDFIAMPAIRHTSQQETKMIISKIMAKDTDKAFILELIDRMDTKQWQPLTLMNGGLFHLSFGAILTGAVLMRGQERKVTIQNGNGKKDK